MCIPITYMYRIKMIFNNEYGWLNAKDSKLLKVSYPFFRDASKINPNNCSYNKWMVLNVEAAYLFQ